MPLYAFRLEAQDGSGHYRQGTGSFESEADARAYLEQKELGAAAYRLDSEELALLEKDEAAAVKAARPVAANVRARLALHRQAEPYKLKRLEEVG